MEVKMKEWKSWIEEKILESKMKVFRKDLIDFDSWGMQDDGNFGRPDKKFWGLFGFRVETPDGSWEQPLVEEYGEGAVVLIKARGEESFLLQAKAEPGNDPDKGYLMLNVTLSASKSNLKGLGIKTVSWVTLFENELDLKAMPQDGGKYSRKINFYGVLEKDKESIKLNENERWFTREEIREAMQEGLIAEHLAQALFTYLI
jgi:hypothetical protein